LSEGDETSNGDDGIGMLLGWMW